MSKRLDETIGAVGFDNLINGQYPPAEVFTVKIRKEATEAKSTSAALFWHSLPVPQATACV